METFRPRIGLPRAPVSGGMASLFALAVLGLSCANGYRSQSLRLRMPPCPELWTELAARRGMALDLALVDSRGRHPLASSLPFGAEIEVPAPEEDFAVFLAEPVGTRIAMKPAGALHPPQAAGGVLELDFPGGWSASVALGLLARDPVAARSFNYGRLELEAASRLGDPWLCRPEGIVSEILLGRFSARDLKPRECFVVSLALRGRSAEGELLWLPESPYAAPVREAGGRLSPCLPEGASVLYRGGERLAVELDAEGRASAFLMPD